MSDDYNSDAERELAISKANTAHLEHLRGFVAQIFALPDVEEALCAVYGNQLADAIEVLGERGEL